MADKAASKAYKSARVEARTTYREGIEVIFLFMKSMAVFLGVLAICFQKMASAVESAFFFSMKLCQLSELKPCLLSAFVPLSFNLGY